MGCDTCRLDSVSMLDGFGIFHMTIGRQSITQSNLDSRLLQNANESLFERS